MKLYVFSATWNNYYYCVMAESKSIARELVTAEFLKEDDKYEEGKLPEYYQEIEYNQNEIAKVYIS